jgi:hypothetical protein
MFAIRAISFASTAVTLVNCAAVTDMDASETIDRVMDIQLTLGREASRLLQDAARFFDNVEQKAGKIDLARAVEDSTGGPDRYLGPSCANGKKVVSAMHPYEDIEIVVDSFRSSGYVDPESIRSLYVSSRDLRRSLNTVIELVEGVVSAGGVSGSVMIGNFKPSKLISDARQLLARLEKADRQMVAASFALSNSGGSWRVFLDSDGNEWNELTM